MRKQIWIIILALIIIVGIICGIIMSQASKAIPSSKLENVEQNKTTNTEVYNEKNEIEQNEIENTIQENVEANTQTNTSTETEKPVTESEKAIQIVKKDYRNSNENIQYNVEGKDESGRYIVTVRDSETTQALAFYFVNVSNSTFTKKQMD